jgi:hypothetical protein
MPEVNLVDSPLTITATAGVTARLIRPVGGLYVGNLLGWATVTANFFKRIRYATSELEATASFSGKLTRITPMSKAYILGTATVECETLHQYKSLGQVGITAFGTMTVKPPKRYRLAAASIQAEASMEAFRWDRSIYQDMLDYLPKYYEDSFTVSKIMQVVANEYVRLTVNAYDVLNQFTPETASEWGLARWEKICLIKPLENATIAQRRASILKRLRGIGTVTLSVFTSLIEEYYSARIVVDEELAHVTIQWTGIRDTPPEFAEIEYLTRQVLPAHMTFEFESSFLTFEELAKLRFSQLAGMTFTDIKNYIPPGYAGH